MNEQNAKRFFFEMDDIFNKVGLRYFLFLGTLLGAIREKRFIPLDIDFDIGVFQEEFAEKSKKLFGLFEKRNFKPKWKTPNARCKKNNIVTGLRIYKGGVMKGFKNKEMHCDICCFIKHKDCRYYPRDGSNLLLAYPAKTIGELKEIDFYGRKIKVPFYAEEFLELTYGKDWRIPHKEFQPESGIYSQIRPKNDDEFWKTGKIVL